MPFKNPHPLFNTWMNMKDRCRNPRAKAFKHYGGRGIRVCERWSNDFHAFVSDMGPRPDGFMIDRIDVNGNYSPENCRWVSAKDSQRNRRDTQRVVIDGTSYLVRELVLSSGRKDETIMRRAAEGLPMAEVIAAEPRHNLNGLAIGGRASGAKQQARTHCSRGHAFTEMNTRLTKQGWRVCRQCKADRAAGRV